jgi:hypothetical protein
MRIVVMRASLIFLLLINSSLAFADSWSHGKIDIVESYSDYILIRWDGPNTENCSDSNNVVIDAASLGSEGAFERAFTLALASAASGNPIRFHLRGCGDGDSRKQGAQEAQSAQMCTKSTCSYQ